MLNTVQDIVTRALSEDAPWGDITSQALIPIEAGATAQFVAREEGVMAAAEVIPVAFPECNAKILIGDGQAFTKGDVLATIKGGGRTILLGERVALNLAQHLCGVASLTRQYVDAVSGTHARIVDTRKTTPGLRQLEKHAVLCGGGHNHRFSLSDAVMVKDNHLTFTPDVTTALREMKAKLPHTVSIEVEVDRLDQIEAVLESGVVNTIMLDNFSLTDLQLGMQQINKRALVEASGGVNLTTVRAIAETGIDIISVGALTHSAPAIDIGLDIVLT